MTDPSSTACVPPAKSGRAIRNEEGRLTARKVCVSGDSGILVVLSGLRHDEFCRQEEVLRNCDRKSDGYKAVEDALQPDNAWIWKAAPLLLVQNQLSVACDSEAVNFTQMIDEELFLALHQTG